MKFKLALVSLSLISSTAWAGAGTILAKELDQLLGNAALRNAYVVSKSAESGIPTNVLAHALEEATALRAAGALADNAQVLRKGESIAEMQARISGLTASKLQNGVILKEKNLIVSSFRSVCPTEVGGEVRAVAAMIARDSAIGKSIERFVGEPLSKLQGSVRSGIDEFIKASGGKGTSPAKINQMLSALAGQNGEDLNRVRHFAAYLDLASKKTTEGEAAATFLKFNDVNSPNWAKLASEDGNFELLHQLKAGELSELKATMDDIMKKHPAGKWQSELEASLTKRATTQERKDALEVMKKLGCPPLGKRKA